MTKDSKVVNIKSERLRRNGILMPGTGLLTRRVWDIADELNHIVVGGITDELKHRAAEDTSFRKDVLAQAVEEGIKLATASSQYWRWCRFRGYK